MTTLQACWSGSKGSQWSCLLASPTPQHRPHRRCNGARRQLVRLRGPGCSAARAAAAQSSPPGSAPTPGVTERQARDGQLPWASTAERPGGCPPASPHPPSPPRFRARLAGPAQEEWVQLDTPAAGAQAAWPAAPTEQLQAPSSQLASGLLHTSLGDGPSSLSPPEGLFSFPQLPCSRQAWQPALPGQVPQRDSTASHSSPQKRSLELVPQTQKGLSASLTFSQTPSGDPLRGPCPWCWTQTTSPQPPPSTPQAGSGLSAPPDSPEAAQPALSALTGSIWNDLRTACQHAGMGSPAPPGHLVPVQLGLSAHVGWDVLRGPSGSGEACPGWKSAPGRGLDHGSQGFQGLGSADCVSVCCTCWACAQTAVCHLDTALGFMT